MSVSAILLNSSVTGAPSGPGQTTDVQGAGDAFGTILAAKTDALAGLQSDTDVTKTSPADDVPATDDDRTPTSPDAIYPTLWLALTPQIIPQRETVEGPPLTEESAKAPVPNPVLTPVFDKHIDADIINAQGDPAFGLGSFKTASAAVQASENGSAQLEESPKAQSPDLETEGNAPAAPPVVAQQQSGNRALADAALASLRALPDAAALQQATISQRKAVAVATTISDVPPIRPTLSGTAPSNAQATTISTAPTGNGSAALSDIAPGAQPSSETRLDPGSANDAFDVAVASELADIVPEVVEQTVLPVSDRAGPVSANLSSTPTSPSTSPVATDASLSSLSRATIETTANLAAQITSRLAGRSTRFELGLTPEGLGRVDVTLDIDADGQLAARLAFDNPLAATELKGRADELRRQLEDAGFTLARDALDFSSRDNSSDGGNDRRHQRATAYADRHAAQADFADAPSIWTLPPTRQTPQGVDVKV